MMRSFDNVFPSNVLTYISDRSVDYTLLPQETGLTEQQMRALAGDLGRDLDAVCNVRQVHEDNIVIADKVEGTIKEADGILTDKKDLPIAIRTADCLSIFLYDPHQPAIGLVHCGWQPTRLNILTKALGLMKERYSSRAGDIMAVIGPGIRGCHYEVGREFIDFFPEDVDKKDGLYYLDLAAVNHKELLHAGVKEKNIHDCKVCTYCESDCFSYRREDDKAGRMISLMMLKKDE